ncbi:4'-phosphopantetheinyl transferase family protein [Streptomyces profundus]|uniref:4'-phosphopantetheinyl transferase family protein n=1 Tax=Streptomyces profundus TaxID=2867410 RepID=UPI001D16B2B9|nr:4'-phosphopantetheinyl transferase superfamily protein [Streptomyces sp. MA3_2.13]UED86498.1 4'-phosphopantetheinyl transferase superfamily protein [Streptomyces sp. MA3_2.13]
MSTGPGFELWWAAPGDADPALRELLAPDELARLDRYRVPAAADRYLTGRALLRLVLGRWLDLPARLVPLTSGCPDCGGPHGRPRLPERYAWLGLSVSHSGGRVGVAVGPAPLGLDIAEIDQDIDLSPDGGVLTSALAPAEAAALLALAPEARAAAFAVVWARKEAALKALGVGLAQPPARLVVSLAHEPPAIREMDPALRPPDGRLTLHDLAERHTGERYRGCLATISQHSESKQNEKGRESQSRLMARDGTTLLLKHFATVSPH